MPRGHRIPVPVIKAAIEEATKDWEETKLATTVGSMGMYSGNDETGRMIKTSVRQQIAWACGVSVRTLFAIFEGERETVYFETADKITSGLEVEHFWYNDGPLAAWYDPPAKVA